jgi:hypothetical protein
MWCKLPRTVHEGIILYDFSFHFLTVNRLGYVIVSAYIPTLV